MSKKEIKQEYLKQLVEYDEETGQFTWKARPVEMFTDGAKFRAITNMRRWNARYAGTIAGCKGSHGYWFISIDNQKQRAHRLAFLFVHGVVPKYIDHIDHDPLNNRIDNLRGVTHKQNCRNQVIRKNNSSGVTGVYWRKDINRWAAQIMVDDRCIPLGTYKVKADAVKSRREADKEYGFHKNHGTKAA